VRGLALVRMRRAMSEQVLALRLSDGRSAWQRTLAAASTLSLAGGLVAVASGSRDVLLLDPATGAVLQTLTHPRRVVEKAGFLPGHLLVLAHAGGVDFYGPRRAAPRPLGAAAQGRCARELGLERAAALLRRHRPREGVRWLGRALGDDETVRYDQWSAPLMNLEGLRRTAGWVDPAVCPAARLRTPPRINGLLDEYWPDWCRVELRAPERLGFVRGHRSPVQAWQGPHDLAADLYLAWDETNFYVTLEVFDRIRVQADGSKTHLNGDLVYLVIDPMGDGGTAFGYDDLVLVSASWKKGTSPFRGRKSSLKAKNFSSRSREDGAGLVLEDALPWTYINDQLTQRGLRAHHIRPRKGVSFGFNLAVVDDDGRGAEAYLTLAPGLSFGRDDRPGVWGRFGRHQLLVRCATPGTFARVVLK